MKLLVGLGNPGPKYETTRHNAGFLVLDLLAEDAGATFQSQPKFQGDLAKGRLLGEECLFLKPMTFMNVSGRSVAPLLHFYKIPPADLLVLHDDIDLPAGKVRARETGGHGGHNGIRSIIAETGFKDFHRIKLGVGRPEEVSEQDVSSWVLGQMSDAELLAVQQEMLRDTIDRIKGIFERSAKKT